MGVEFATARGPNNASRARVSKKMALEVESSD